MANPLTINNLFLFSCAAYVRSVPLRPRRGGLTFSFAALSLFTALGGCMSQTPPAVTIAPTVAAPDPAAPTMLTAEAESALREAEDSVQVARAKRALWTAAVAELDKARASAKRFDSSAAIAHAREAIELCVLSIKQLSAPPVKW